MQQLGPARSDVSLGATYVVAVGSKRFVFAPRVIAIDDNIGDLDVVADSVAEARTK